MSKKASWILIAAVVLAAAFLVLGGGAWLWSLFLKMHGMQGAHH
jgi:hypothetical protein